MLEVFAIEYSKLRHHPEANTGYAQQFLQSASAAQRDELSTRATLDKAARQFARNGTWPELEDKERFFLRLRLRFAYEYALLASISVPTPRALFRNPAGKYDSTAMFVLFLVDIWKLFGIDNWLAPIDMLTDMHATGKAHLGPIYSTTE